MIEINLLPPELRDVDKDKKTTTLELSKLILLVPACVALLFCVHVVLWVGGMMRVGTVKRLSAEWSSLESERKRIQEYDLEYATVTKQVGKVREMASRRILWAGKLKALSRHLPAGVWFTDLSVSPDEFSLQGSVLAFETDEMLHIRELIDGLNSDAEFISDFTELQLSSVQQRTIVMYDVADFLVTGRLKRDGN
jgi:Tfp pilus assembly protein PilN